MSRKDFSAIAKAISASRNEAELIDMLVLYFRTHYSSFSPALFKERCKK